LPSVLRAWVSAGKKARTLSRLRRSAITPLGKARRALSIVLGYRFVGARSLGLALAELP